MSAVADWEKVYERFPVDEPDVPAEWRVDRPDDRLEQVRLALNTPFARQKYLLLGTRGSGKTTELYALLNHLPPTRIGVYVDLAELARNRYGDEGLLDRMAAWEVVLLAGMAAWRQNLAIDAYNVPSAVATVPIVDALVKREAQTFSTGFHMGYDRVLCTVRDAPRHQIPEADARTVDELLARYWLLPHRNGEEWFHPHPLLLSRLTPSLGS